MTYSAKLRAYYYALKPERTYANVMTTAAGFLFACVWHINWARLLATLAGTTLVVMSACAANNATDRGIDARMPRTRKRATATGEVPVKHVVAIAIVFGVAGMAILLRYVNTLTTLLGLVGYIDYVVLYAWSKRRTPHSTLIGTISGAIPLVAGYTAVTGRLDTTALLLGLAMTFWQMGHFYSIAIFRRKDYAAGSLPVWSVRYGVISTQKWLLFYVMLYFFVVVWLAIRAPGGWMLGVVMSTLTLYWLYRGFVGFRALKPEKWARGMFGLSLVILLAFSASVAFIPLMP
ncbi:MAG TPA: heme o synthase [Candidatus Saccharimonadia bacterium]|nr:heme o synthase [Candidatus Saccharimonadia bacterium]